MNNNTYFDDLNLKVITKAITSSALSAYAVSDITEVQSQKTYILADTQGSLIPLESIPSFDSLGITLNEYKTCVAINLTFTLINDSVCTVVASTKNDFIMIGAENWLSNAVQFVPVSYNSANLSLHSYGTPLPFVKFEQDQPFKIKSMEILRSNYTLGNISLWFILEYNTEIMLQINNENAKLNVDFINYTSDITLEIDVL